jgi:uncharacterized Fe-S cluster-containing radical SAM superfamily protein
MRERAIDPDQKRILITNYHGSNQEKDLTEPANCQGYGRIRHFNRDTGTEWPENPLPIVPAARALNLEHRDSLKAQVFQNAACNWRCWYCYVDFALLSADPNKAGFLTADQLVDLYLQETDRPLIIDLSGGQPDLVPEWVPWMMAALKSRGLEMSTYLWSDDNLSTDYFSKFLIEEDRELISSYPNYGKVCCLKGFDETSFSFNTGASPDLFEKQFELIAEQLNTGIDIYLYVTFTSPSRESIPSRMAAFVDRLQGLHPNLPLRTVPLQIRVYTPMRSRMESIEHEAMANQQIAVNAWSELLASRFSSDQLNSEITEIHL